MLKKSTHPSHDHTHNINIPPPSLSLSPLTPPFSLSLSLSLSYTDTRMRPQNRNNPSQYTHYISHFILHNTAALHSPRTDAQIERGGWEREKRERERERERERSSYSCAACSVSAGLMKTSEQDGRRTYFHLLTRHNTYSHHITLSLQLFSSTIKSLDPTMQAEPRNNLFPYTESAVMVFASVTVPRVPSFVCAISPVPRSLALPHRGAESRRVFHRR